MEEWRFQRHVSEPNAFGLEAPGQLGHRNAAPKGPLFHGADSLFARSTFLSHPEQYDRAAIALRSNASQAALLQFETVAAPSHRASGETCEPHCDPDQVTHWKQPQLFQHLPVAEHGFAYY